MNIKNLKNGDTVTLDNGVTYKFHRRQADGSIFLTPFETKTCRVEIWYNGKDFIPVVPKSEEDSLEVGAEGVLGTLVDVYLKTHTVKVEPSGN